MATINDIVNITITREVRVAPSSFGIMLFLATFADSVPTVPYTTRTRKYTKAAAVLADFPQTTDLNKAIYNAAVAYFGQSNTPDFMYIGRQDSTDADVKAALDAIILENNAWYALALLDRTTAVVTAAAEWIINEANLNKNYKILGISDSSASTPANATAILALNSGQGTDRVFSIYNIKSTSTTATPSVDDEFPEVAWFGKMLPLAPGSATWMFKTLNYVNTSDELTVATETVLLDKMVNVYQNIADVLITREGTTLVTASKNYIDDRIGVDWLVAEMARNVYGLLAASPKVPYTNTGITQVESRVKQTLDQAVTAGVLAATPAYTTSVPDILSVPAQDKINRVLNNVFFTATLAGAIHKVNIEGFITV